MLRRHAARLAALLLAAVVLSSAAAEVALAARKAFIVGNSRYAHAPPLPNPLNDARDLGERLKGLGYAVEVGLDLARADFLTRFQAYARSLQPDDVALLYFAGHALQIGGENYLFPVDAKVEGEQDARTKLVPLNALLADLSRGPRSRLVILDACRNNPFESAIVTAPATRSAGGATRGLARVYAGVGTFVAYSTQPGNVALDGDGRNSPFTGALVRHIGEPGADVHAVMRRVRADVQRATAEQQVPWENSSLVDEIVFNAGTARPGGPSRLPAGDRTTPSGPPVAYSYVTGLDPKGDNFLALRTSPAGDGERIATMGPDTLLTVLESRGAWRRVQLLDGTTGWAHSNWIKCCRTQPGIQAIGPAPPAAPPTAQPATASCDDLWRRRNAIWHRHGYCFTTEKAKQVFGNAGCSRDQTQARAAMSAAERAEIDALLEQERRARCN